MSRIQTILASRPDSSVVDAILDAFQAHREQAGAAATTVHIPPAMEADLDCYYQARYGRTARQMVPTWVGIRKVHWGTKEFKVT
jgi:hypothetical protein